VGIGYSAVTLRGVLPGETQTMFNFDADRFVKIQTGAIALAAEIDAAAERYVAEGIDSVFFLGRGEAAILMYPAADLVALAQRRLLIDTRPSLLFDHEAIPC
jgi:fructoselysine-6-phosphate deglycase